MRSDTSEGSLFTDSQCEFLETFSQHRYHSVLATLFDQVQKGSKSYKKNVRLKLPKAIADLEFKTEEEEKKYFKDLKNHHEQRAKHFWNHAQKSYPLPFRKFSDHICNEHVSIGDRFMDWVVNSFSNNQAPTFYWEKYIRPSLFEEIEL